MLVSRKIQHTAELDCRQRGHRLPAGQFLRRNRDFSFNHLASRGQAHSRAAICCQDQVFCPGIAESELLIPLPLSVPRPLPEGQGRARHRRCICQLILPTGI